MSWFWVITRVNCIRKYSGMVISLCHLNNSWADKVVWRRRLILVGLSCSIITVFIFWMENQIFQWIAEKGNSYHNTFTLGRRVPHTMDKNKGLSALQPLFIKNNRHFSTETCNRIKCCRFKTNFMHVVGKWAEQPPKASR